MSNLVKNSNGFPELVSRLWDAEKTLFSDFFGVDGGVSSRNRPEVPSINVIEEEKQFLIEMAAPGKQRDDFKVEVEDGYLKISSEKEVEKEENKPNFRRKEFSYDFFSRELLLPDNCLPDKLTAKYEHGILQLQLPKKDIVAAKPKKQIKVD